MKTPKYQIKFSDLDQRHNVAKLERDGYDRRRIIDAVYKHTDGMTNNQRNDFVSKLYDRGEK